MASTITGLKLSQLNILSAGSTGTLFYVVTPGSNGYRMYEKDLYNTLYTLHLSGGFQPKNEDWRLVHITGNESITGNKTFVQLAKFSSLYSSGSRLPLITGGQILLGSAGNISGSNINLAGYNNTTPCIGQNAGGLNTNASNSSPNSVILGYGAGQYSNASSVVMVGSSAGASSALANSNIAFSVIANNGIFIGDSAGYDATNASDSTFIGYNAGYGAEFAPNSIFIGSSAGATTPNASYSIFMGNGAGTDRSKTLWIDTTSPTDPLIYGEFDNRFFKINGSAQITGELIAPNIVSTTGTQSISGNKKFFNRLVATGIYDNSVISINTKDRILYDLVGRPRYDWQNNHLSGFFFSNFLSVDIDGGGLYDVNANPALNWIFKTISGNWTIYGNTVNTGSFQSQIILSGNAPILPTSNGISGQLALSGQKLFICTGSSKWGYINITPW